MVVGSALPNFPAFICWGAVAWGFWRFLEGKILHFMLDDISFNIIGGGVVMMLCLVIYHLT